MSRCLSYICTGGSTQTMSFSGNGVLMNDVEDGAAVALCQAAETLEVKLFVGLVLAVESLLLDMVM